MNERIIQAISKLKKAQDELEIKLKSMEQNIDEKGSLNMQKALFTVADDLARYTIKDGNWYYNGKDTGIRAEAHDGKDGKPGLQGIPGKEGRPGKDGRPGKEGKPGKDGRPGRDGKDGKPGKDGRSGRDGKDGITPELKIGKIEVSPEYGGAMAKLRPGKDNIMYLDLTLPRGPQGFAGFDGKDAKINGENTLTIEAGRNITLDQEGSILTINSTGGGGGGSEEDNITITKNSQNKIQTVGIIDQNAGNIVKYWEGTQAEYDAIVTKDNNTIYYITDAEDVYVTNTDYATPSVGGVLKVSNGDYGMTVDNGVLKGAVRTLAQYNDMSSKGIVCKGTLENVISGKANKISVVQTSTSTIEINPNTFYKFGEVASLNITLASITDNTIYNEYMFEFVSGTTATTLTLPSSIKWLETPTIDANKIYQCSIVDNVGLLVGVTNV